MHDYILYIYIIYLPLYIRTHYIQCLRRFPPATITTVFVGNFDWNHGWRSPNEEQYRRLWSLCRAHRGPPPSVCYFLGHGWQWCHGRSMWEWWQVRPYPSVFQWFHMSQAFTSHHLLMGNGNCGVVQLVDAQLMIADGDAAVCDDDDDDDDDDDRYAIQLLYLRQCSIILQHFGAGIKMIMKEKGKSTWNKGAIQLSNAEWWYGWWKKSCTSWYGKYPIIYSVLCIPGGCLGFLPSTVSTCYQHSNAQQFPATWIPNFDSGGSYVALEWRSRAVWNPVSNVSNDFNGRFNGALDWEAKKRYRNLY